MQSESPPDESTPLSNRSYKKEKGLAKQLVKSTILEDEKNMMSKMALNSEGFEVSSSSSDYGP